MRRPQSAPSRNFAICIPKVAHQGPGAVFAPREALRVSARVSTAARAAWIYDWLTRAGRPTAVSASRKPSSEPPAYRRALTPTPGSPSVV